ncbi:hypothetical protein OKW40_001774 [Paraburkholderia sp. RAU6.4a]
MRNNPGLGIMPHVMKSRLIASAIASRTPGSGAQPNKCVIHALVHQTFAALADKQRSRWIGAEPSAVRHFVLENNPGEGWTHWNNPGFVKFGLMDDEQIFGEVYVGQSQVQCFTHT